MSFSQGTVLMQNYIGFSKPLLAWYRENARELPWRNEPTPYRVWVSEIMLQQTRVEVGKVYFERFLAELPDVFHLANVSDQRLLKLWEGMGYYNRARNLKKAAGILMEQYRGVIPASYDALAALPGIGPYTAGAIASIAFGIAVPAVDGNVQRVLSRLYENRAEISTPAAKRWAQDTAAAEMGEENPGAYNQALMELGALVCIPTGEPKCGVCPLAGHCRAFHSGTQAALPVKAPKKQRRIEKRTVFLLETENGVVLHKREEKGLLAGLWEFPNLPGPYNGDALSTLLDNLGLAAESIVPIRSAGHVFTHIEWQMDACRVAVRFDGERPKLPPKWILADRQKLLTEYPIPSAFKAFTEQL